MRKLTLAGVLVLGLVGCAGSSFNPNVATPNQEYVGLNGYLAAVKTGDNYVKLPTCPTNAPVCKTQALAQQVYSALRAARGARKIISANLAAGQPMSLTALQTLQAAYAIIQQIPTH